jgi:hypothetical protein
MHIARAISMYANRCIRKKRCIKKFCMQKYEKNAGMQGTGTFRQGNRIKISDPYNPEG